MAKEKPSVKCSQCDERIGTPFTVADFCSKECAIENLIGLEPAKEKKCQDCGKRKAKRFVDHEILSCRLTPLCEPCNIRRKHDAAESAALQKRMNTPAARRQQRRRCKERERSIHTEWKHYADVTEKVIKAKTLRRWEAELLARAVIGNCYQYHAGNFNYADGLGKRLERIIDKVYGSSEIKGRRK